MDAKEFVQIRKELELTQEDLAKVLAISTRAVQSYEQGWRNIVPAAERNLLLLLMYARQATAKRKRKRACWSVENCSDSKKNKCMAHRLNLGFLCWYITGTVCNSECSRSWKKKIQTCRKCPVFEELFQKQGSGTVPEN